ncbi:uncharacterized protein LOC108217030 [Daucus carota subsp. sativus]|uniref:uncharacterized protein LOC108217030 n=1 Tax=Daucus carota subsp. sativus TaxID=79200 RepID=UPI0007EFE332|nr:PREDICTED: uncharacterized protein LOC108217030 [Daucus carota subsp. sativus]
MVLVLVGRKPLSPFYNMYITAIEKVLNLVWRALSLCLATLSQLQQKHVHVQGFCRVCANGEESIVHALVTCPFAAQCWKTLRPDIHLDGVTDFTEWLDSATNASITLCWAIWRARNDLVWNLKTTSVYRVVAAAKQYLSQWKAAQGRLFRAPLQPSVEGDGAVTWAKPQQNTVKVSVDAAIFEDREEVGLGMVARDSTGQLSLARTNLHQGVVSPEVAEAMAIKEALSWIKQERWPHVVLESDCLVVIQAIRSKAPMRSPFGVLIEHCRQSICHMNNIELYFIK